MNFLVSERTRKDDVLEYFVRQSAWQTNLVPWPLIACTYLPTWHGPWVDDSFVDTAISV